jgi:hypothetical protein
MCGTCGSWLWADHLDSELLTSAHDGQWLIADVTDDYSDVLLRDPSPRTNGKTQAELLEQRSIASHMRYI